MCRKKKALSEIVIVVIDFKTFLLYSKDFTKMAFQPDSHQSKLG